MPHDGRRIRAGTRLTCMAKTWRTTPTLQTTYWRRIVRSKTTLRRWEHSHLLFILRLIRLKEFTMEFMLKTLNIEHKTIGFDAVMGKWIRE
jgi:hypothetical protein